MSMLSVCIGLSGCGESTGEKGNASVEDAEHGHGDGHEDHGPETLAEALTSLKGMRDTIRDAFGKNDPDAAHDPLHEIGHVLGSFEDLAAKEKVSDDQAAVIKAQVEILFDAFGAVDKTMHGQEGKSWNEVSKAVDEAMSALEAACSAQPAGNVPGTESAAAPGEPAASANPAGASPAGDTAVEKSQDGTEQDPALGNKSE
jgi:hypothetical protein